MNKDADQIHDYAVTLGRLSGEKRRKSQAEMKKSCVDMQIAMLSLRGRYSLEELYEAALELWDKGYLDLCWGWERDSEGFPTGNCLTGHGEHVKLTRA